jgi:hypothetical protein
MTRDEKPEKLNLLLGDHDDDDDDDDEEDDDYRPSDDEDAGGLSLTEMIADKLTQAQRFTLQSLDFTSAAGEDGEDDDGGSDVEVPPVDDSESPSNGMLQLTDEKKKRAEQLWAELNSLSRPNKTTSTTVRPEVALIPQTPIDLPKPNKVTKVYDFAGESVVVEEEQQSSSRSESIECTTADKDDQKVKSAGTSRPGLAPPKRSSGLGGLVSSLTKKAKMSTLIKSKLDWEGFKKDEGLEDELRNHRKNKDNFVDKQAFLQRADLKQFEQEKAVRDKRRTTQSK